jgi:hypothetical protein
MDQKEEKFMKEVENIKSMSQVDMARLWRFAPSGHPYFDRSNPLSDIFEKRFRELGFFSPDISKRIGWGD